jgi:hypothetical protein
VSQRHPPFVDPTQASGEYEGGNHQKSRQYHGPPSDIFTAQEERPKTYNCEDASHGQAERAQLFVCDIISHRFTSAVSSMFDVVSSTLTNLESRTGDFERLSKL